MNLGGYVFKNHVDQIWEQAKMGMGQMYMWIKFDIVIKLRVVLASCLVKTTNRYKTEGSLGLMSCQDYQQI